MQTEKTFYDLLGGAESIESIVDDFYLIMQTDPAATRCLKVHEGLDFKVSAQKLKYFLTGWLGGPQLYLESFGHPRLRLRHSPFKISETEAIEWLYCMNLALTKANLLPDLRDQLMSALAPVARMLVNQQGHN
jgi:hemoglobin